MSEVDVRAVSMRTGMELPWWRSSCTICMPSMPGSITSMMTASYRPLSAEVRPALPSYTASQLNPASDTMRTMASARFLSSSTTSMFMGPPWVSEILLLGAI